MSGPSHHPSVAAHSVNVAEDVRKGKAHNALFVHCLCTQHVCNILNKHDICFLLFLFTTVNVKAQVPSLLTFAPCSSILLAYYKIVQRFCAMIIDKFILKSTHI